MRRRICAGLEFLDIRLDPAREPRDQAEVEVSPPDAPVKVLVIRTNEEIVVARETARLLRSG